MWSQTLKREEKHAHPAPVLLRLVRGRLDSTTVSGFEHFSCSFQSKEKCYINNDGVGRRQTSSGLGTFEIGCQLF